MTGAPHSQSDVAVVGFGPRVVAEVIDLIAMWLLIVAFGGGAWAVAAAAGVSEPVTVMIVVAVGALVGVGYWVILHAHGRQTLGKRVIGAVVTDMQLRTIGHGRALARLIAEIASVLPLYLGYLWPLWDPQRQALHDKLAGTLVIRRTDPRRT